MARSVSYTINAKDKTQAALNSAKGGVSGFKSALGSLGGVLAGAFSVVAIKQAAGAIGDLTDIYGVQQDAEIKLTAAAQNNPLLNGEAVNRLKAYASELQGASIYGDEQLIEYEAWLAAQSRTEDEIKKIMQASIDLASSGVMPLESAVKNLSKTYGGTAGELAESIPALKELTKEQMANGEAVRLIAEQYQGMGAALASGNAGIKQQISNTIGDIKESFGEIFAGISGDTNKNLLPVFNKINEWLQNNKTQIINVFRNIPEIALTTFELIKNIAKQIFSVEFLVSFGKVIFDFLLVAGKNVFETLYSYLKAIGTTFWEPLTAGFQFAVSGFKFLFAQTINFLIDKLNWILEQYNKLASTGFGDFLGLESAELMEKKEVSYEKPDTNVLGNIADAWTDFGKNALDFIPKMIDAEKEYLDNILSTGAELFGDEFDVFTSDLETVLNEPLEVETPEIVVQQPTETGGGGGSDSGGGLGFISDIFGGGLESFSAIFDIVGQLSGGFSQLLTGLSSVSALFGWFSVIISGVLDVIAGPINDLLEPLVGFLVIIGQTLGQMLIPVIQLLEPLLGLVSEALVFLYNYAIRPLANSIIWVIVSINNLVAKAINAIISAINKIPFVSVGGRMSTMSYDAMALDEISLSDMANSGSQYLGDDGTGYSSGSGASYAQSGDVYLTFNIDYQVGVSAFDDNDLAVKINELIERAKKLGLIA